MKHLVIRTVVSLSLLFTLVAILGAINPTAHADGLQRVDCSTGNPIKILTDTEAEDGGDWVCFAGIGWLTGMTLDNDSVIYTGDYSYVTLCFQDDGQQPTIVAYPNANTTYSIYNGQADGSPMNVNQVHDIADDPSLPVPIHPTSC